MDGDVAVEPVPDEAAATVVAGGRRLLVIADFHAGIEAAIRAEEGINIDSDADRRRERVRSLLASTDPDRLVVLGDFMHSIGGPGGAERGEIEVLLAELSVPVTVVRGNHDGAIEEWLADPDVEITDGRGTRIGPVGFAHGHTWPAPDVVTAEVVCVGHEHSCVRLTDEVGGSRVERVWLRGGLDPRPFRETGRYDDVGEWPAGAELVVFPPFNERSGGTWVNVAGGEFLCPFLPAGLRDGQAYMLDGTRLGPYDRI